MFRVIVTMFYIHREVSKFGVPHIATLNQWLFGFEAKNAKLWCSPDTCSALYFRETWKENRSYKVSLRALNHRRNVRRLLILNVMRENVM